MTIPIAETSDMAQVEAIRPIVEGRACVVVGSAPLPTATAETLPGECVIAVNGSISSLPGAADLWVLNSKQQDRPNDLHTRPLHKTMLRQGKGRTAGHLVLLRGPVVQSEGWTLERLDTLACRYQSWSVLDKTTKLFLEKSLCARKETKPCSAGILTVAMALYCGADHVRMVGFSFVPGYNYIEKNQTQYWWRDHVLADQRALVALRDRYGSKLSGEILAKVAA